MLTFNGGGLSSNGLNNLRVNCYSGQSYAERPKSFLWEGAEYEVEEIEREWREPGRDISRSEPEITNCSSYAIMSSKTSGG